MLARALPLGAWTEATTPDWTVFASAMGIAVLATLLVVLVPTVSLWRGDLRGALSSARTGGLEGRGGRLENGLVVAQVALAVLIASGAALLVRSVANLYAVDAGVRTEGVGVVDVTMGRSLSFERRQQTIDELTAALAELPGVRAAAAVQTLPLRGGGYGVIAHFATRRRRDWAIRIALGMTESGVIAHVVRHGALLVAAGIGIGALAATALARLLASLLYGVSAADPLAFAAAGAVLLAVSLLAAFIPAWRVAMTDPMIMLREQ